MLGDRDLGLHLVRTQALRSGEPLSTVTARLAEPSASTRGSLPATDDELRTWIDTPAGAFSFQDWFVRRGHRDEVDGVRFVGDASAAPGVLDALANADADRDRARATRSSASGRSWRWPTSGTALVSRRVPCVAVSPLVGGRAVKGPADRMLARLRGGTTPAHVASCYEGLIDALVVDESDPTGAAAPCARLSRAR